MKLALGLSSYDTKKELDHAAGVHTSNLAAKKDCCESWNCQTRH